MGFRLVHFFAASALAASACSNSTEIDSDLSVNFHCQNKIIAWAEKAAKINQTKIAHIHWPLINPESDEIAVSLYAQLNVYCDEGCDVTDDDQEMYSFYRSTHYWALEKVFTDIVQCNGANTDIQTNLNGKILQQTYESELAFVTTTWSSIGCALSGGPKLTQDGYGGCISIKAEPK